MQNNYYEHAAVAHETMMQMVARLDYMTLQPKLILEVSSIGSEGRDLLKKRYPDAQIVSEALQAYSVDLIFANVVQSDFKKNFQVWRSILKPNGLLMFTTLGPDTARELRDQIELPHFTDMHDIGDALVEAGFLDPVMDAEHLTLVYRSEAQLVDELQLGPQHFIFEKNADNSFPLTYEIIYGHAWGPGAPQGYAADEAGTVKIPVSILKQKK